MIEHIEKSLIINGKQSVKLKSGSIIFKNYFKQLPIPFKIYAEFECILEGIKSSDKSNGSYTEKYQAHILTVLLTKLHVFIINLAKNLFFKEEKMLFIGSSKQFLMSIVIVKK